MERLNAILLVVVILCALSLVTSRHQARKMFVDLEREQARARAYEIEYGQLQIEQSTWAMPARVEKVARDQLRMQMPDAGPSGSHRRGQEMKRTGVAAPPLPALRAPLVFGALLFLFALLLARSLYLQRVDNSFLQAQGSSRYSRDLEVPAHRGRIVDRLGDPLAISTPVKAVWAWPDKIEATPEQMRALAAALEMPPAELTRRIAAAGDFVYLKRLFLPTSPSASPRCRSRVSTTRPNTGATTPAATCMSQIVGFTGDRDVGQEGMELAQQAWLGGKPGNRRVIINRRGDIVEDVASIRAPQEGRDLALSIDSRLQYLAYRELKAAIELNKAKAGAIVVLDAQTGEIVALANWPVYNPNNRARTGAQQDAQPRADRHLRAGLVDEAIHHRRRARRRKDHAVDAASTPRPAR